MTIIKLLSLTITNKLNIRVENVRISNYVIITAIIFVSVVVGLKVVNAN